MKSGFPPTDLYALTGELTPPGMSRAALGAVMVGVSRAVLEYCVPYAKDRVAFDEAIAKKQAIA